MRARRSLRATIVLGIAAAALASPAIAQTPGGSGYAWTETREGSATVGAEQTISQQHRSRATGSSGDPPCTWTPVEPDLVGEETLLLFTRVPNAHYAWFIKRCTNPDGSESVQYIPVAITDPAPTPDPEQLRARAVDELHLPSPTIAMSPPGDQVVHVSSWLWIDDAIWRPHTRSVSAGGVTATVTAAPTRTLWDMGNGEVVVCSGPGVPYDSATADTADPPDCSHTYRNSSAGLPGDAYQVTVTIEWGLSWSVTGAPGGGALPGLTTSTSTSVPVGEVQALNQ